MLYQKNAKKIISKGRLYFLNILSATVSKSNFRSSFLLEILHEDYCLQKVAISDSQNKIVVCGNPACKIFLWSFRCLPWPFIQVVYIMCMLFSIRKMEKYISHSRRTILIKWKISRNLKINILWKSRLRKRTSNLTPYRIHLYTLLPLFKLYYRFRIEYFSL